MLLFSKFRIYGHSMSPVLKDGDSVLVSSIPFLFVSPKINDIVAVRYNGKVLIKKIKLIKENKYFIKGENENDSFDSKDFGYVSQRDLLGKFIFKI